ncbi:MAG: ISAzo13 family transposase [Deltaproteobacteria bacterium]|jgi:transposase|nr:ISAzo13 family transposase [Deltaproteobacteria bacterium]
MKFEDGDTEQFFKTVWPHLPKPQRRVVAAAYSKKLGYGGVSYISGICGLSRVTITKAMKELEEEPLEFGRLHRPSAGRPSLVTLEPAIVEAILEIVEESTSGDPQAARLYTLKSTRIICRELEDRGHSISHTKVAQILKQEGYTLQGNFKSDEGACHIDRDAQFKFINRLIKEAMKKNHPIISVDTKKKELIGNFDNKGKQWRKSYHPRIVKGHDFPGPDIPIAHPYGIYDLNHNIGFVNIGTDHDTSEFAVNSIKGWWKHVGKKIYASPEKLIITADCGGSNGYRNRMWKYKLKELANYINCEINVAHFPPGTSKWNRVEHRLFSFISTNWKGEPLVDYETVVNLISATTTVTGLKVTCVLDHKKYNTGKKVTDEQMATIDLRRSNFHGDWNYSIFPNK